MTTHSYSSLSTLAACEARWAYRHLLRLVAVEDDTGPQGAGNLMHAVLAADALQRGHDHDSLLDRPDKLFLYGSTSIAIDWTKPYPVLLPPSGVYTAPLTLSPDNLIVLFEAHYSADPEAQRHLKDTLGDDPPQAIANLWARYAQRWESRTKNELPLLVESRWKRAIPGTEHHLQGRVDEVYLDMARGLIVIRDHKFSGGWQHDPDHLLDLHGYQLHLGAWGVGPKLREHNRSRCDAVEYNRGLFASPPKPQLTKGTRNKDGSWRTKPRLGATVTRYDLTGYLALCASAEAAEAEYEAEQDVLDRLTMELHGDQWWRRNLKPANVNVVRRHVRAAAAQAIRADTIVQASAMPSPSGACTWCDYRHLCRAESYGGFPEPFNPQDYDLRRMSERR